MSLPKPYYEESGIVIYNARCEDVLPDLEPVQIVVTSPPYNVGLKYPSYDDKLPPSVFKRRMRQWFEAISAACDKSSRQYVIVSDEMIWWMRGTIGQCGLKFVQILPWCKPNMASGGGRISSDWNNMTEWVMLFRKGKRTPMINGEGCTFNYLIITAPQRNFDGELHKEYIAQFPVELPRRLISRTPGETVLDPFMGSGTTLIAAKQLGRKAIGIEQDKECCRIAVKRLQQEYFPLTNPEQPKIETEEMFK